MPVKWAVAIQAAGGGSFARTSLALTSLALTSRWWRPRRGLRPALVLVARELPGRAIDSDHTREGRNGPDPRTG